MLVDLEGCDHPAAGLGLEVDHAGKRLSRPGALGDQKPGQGMLARLLGGRREPHHIVGTPPEESVTVGNLGRPSVSVPVLSNASVDPGQPLDGCPTLDQNTPPRQACGRGQHGGGRGQDQGAGTGHHQHRQGGHQVELPGGRSLPPAPGHRPVGSEQNHESGHEHHREEEAGITIGRSFQRRLVLLSLAEEPDHLSQSRRRSDLLGPEFEAAELVDRPREDRVALPLVDGKPLAGQDRLVDGRPARRDDPIGGDAFARPDDHEIAHDQ
ncbi:MAG: hypothetical protein U0794_09385 [Isosphaeraceae bacterium]